MHVKASKYGFMLLLVLCFFHSSWGQMKVEVISGKRTAITSSLLNWKPDSSDPVLQIKTRDDKGLIHAQDLKPLIFKRYQEKKKTEDPLWLKSRNKVTSQDVSSAKNPGTTAVLEEHGQAFVDQNLEGQPYSKINPADPSLAVGPNHIIQMINGNNGSALFSILDKSGNVLVSSSYMDQLPGTSYNGGGDCITWYDQFSDRFIMSEFGDSSKTGIQMNSVILAVSATNDPTGIWYVYEFYCGDFFPDYPKYGNWPSAWFGVTRDFTTEYQGNSIWAFNKVEMLNGNSNTSVIRTRLSDPDDKYNSLVPVTVAGTMGSSDNKGLFLYFNDDELTSSSTDADSLVLLSFFPDFANPSQSKLQIEKSVKTISFSSQICETRNCAPSPVAGYDVISDRLMHKPYLRDFGTYQTIVVNHTIDVSGNGLAGIRWYEWKKNGSWDLFQQGTFSPQEPASCIGIEQTHRFMGSILQNAKGQIALGYNFSSKSNFASLALTGRNKTDQAGEMSYDEKILARGTEYGTEGFRWGDYNDMVPDPLNDSVFWFTGMYGFTSASWKTSIHSVILRNNFNWDAKLTQIEFPTACNNLCSGKISPRIRIKNNGEASINSMRIICYSNGTAFTRFTWNGILSPATEITYTLPELMIPEGKSRFKIELTAPNGNTDENPENNFKEIEVTVAFATQIPYLTDAEDGRTPPLNWILNTTGSNNYGWRVSSQASFKGQKSYWVDNFNFNEKGKTTELVSPRISVFGFDSAQVSFGLAAALFDAKARDTLELLVSTDCGSTFQSIYKKWGEALATQRAFVNTFFIPLSSDWRKEVVDLSPYLGQEINLKFKVTNDFGNNIYIDEILFAGIDFTDNDVALEKYISPKLVGCETKIAPVLEFKNNGKKQLRELEISIWQNGVKKDTKKWTGILNRLGTGLLAFANLNVEPNNDLMAAVESVNGVADEDKSQDSLRTTYSISRLSTKPWTENFNNTSTPSSWPTTEKGTAKGWQRLSVPTSQGIAWGIKNFKSSPFESSTYSPRVDIAKSDSVYLFFELAAANSWGNSDTLLIDCSFNCGETWSNIYKKGGAELQTARIGSYVEFIPQTETAWRKEKIDLSVLSKEKNEIILRFINKGGGNNTIYLDNISIESLALPDKLKENGWMVNPNPATDWINLSLFPNAQKLKSVVLSDLLGRNLRSWDVELNASIQRIPLDIKPYPPGTYVLKLMFIDKTETILVVKKGN